METPSWAGESQSAVLSRVHGVCVSCVRLRCGYLIVLLPCVNFFFLSAVNTTLFVKLLKIQPRPAAVTGAAACWMSEGQHKWTLHSGWSCFSVSYQTVCVLRITTPTLDCSPFANTYSLFDGCGQYGGRLGPLGLNCDFFKKFSSINCSAFPQITFNSLYCIYVW